MNIRFAIRTFKTIGNLTIIGSNPHREMPRRTFYIAIKRSVFEIFHGQKPWISLLQKIENQF